MSATNRDTWLRILHWDKGQTESERFAADLLGLDGFHSIVPSHPLGGPDGMKDIVLKKEGLRWIAAAYFPNREVRFAEVQKKFAADFAGVSTNGADGFVFVTNQPLSLTERAKLEDHAGNTTIEIYDLERLRVMLDSLRGVPFRQRYLGIPISGEDLVAAVGQLGQIMATTASKAISEGLPRSVVLELPTSGEYSLAELAHFAKDQGKSEMHRAYVIDRNLLPAFSNPDHPVPPIILLDDFPTEFADCYRVAHEVAMLLFFLQRCIGLSHMDRLNLEMRMQIARVVERLWRCTIRLRPLINKCQPTLLMVAANRVNSSCAHLVVYMSACHFLQEVVQASEQTGYTSASQALGEASESDTLPYDSEQVVAKWPDIVRSLRNNLTVHEGFRLLSDAFYDLSAEAMRAVRYEKGLPIIPAWMRLLGSSDTRG